MANYLLSERDTQPLLAPLGLSGRIKYTCVALSARYIALGANTGGVYCFHRDHRYIQLLANKEGAVSVVRFSPDEQLLAVVAGGGYLVIWELKLSDSGVCKRVHVSSLLKDGIIKDAVWEGKRGRIYFGDNNGRVAVASLPKAAMKPNIFRRANDIIFQDKTPVVQLDLHGDMLLVSTQSRAVLLMLSSANRTAVQVGKKNREGLFGACFDVREKDGMLVVYSARPGGRLWEAGAERGDVYSTVKLKELLTSPPTTILGHGFNPILPPTSPPSQTPTLTPHYLHSLHNGKFLVSCDNNCLYLWQPSSWQPVSWTNNLGGIVGVACEGGRVEDITLCILVDEGRKVLMVTMATLLRCIQSLLQEKLMDQVTKLVFGNLQEVLNLLSSNPPLLLTSLPNIITHNIPPCTPLSLQLLCLQSHINTLTNDSNIDEVSTIQTETDDQLPTAESKSPPSSFTEMVTMVTSDRHVSHSHDDSDVILQNKPRRVHRRSNSWSGVPQHMVSTGSSVEDIFLPDDEGVWPLSDSHTPSNPSLSLEDSQEDPFSIDDTSLQLETESAVLTPSSEGSPWQQSITSSVEIQSSPSTQGAEQGVWPEEIHTTRSQSLQLTCPPPIATATLLDHDSDVIAVPVRSPMTTSGTGSKSKSKKRSRHSKRSSLSSLSSLSLPPSILTPSHNNVVDGVDVVDGLVHIPEEVILPFPDVGLPSDVVYDRPQSLTHSQRASSFVTKMKELAKQGGHNIETAHETFNQPVRKVKELLTSLATPVPTALSIPSSMPQTVFVNEDYVIPQPFTSDQSGFSLVSHDRDEIIPESKLSLITVETKAALVMPDVYCSVQAIRTAVSDWLVVMETAVIPDQSLNETVLVDLLTLAMEVGVFGSESGLVPFLRHHSKLLNGMRTMRVLSQQEWDVRCEGWNVLVNERKMEIGGDPMQVVMEMTNQNARASDLPTYLTSLMTSDPLTFVTVCVKSWPRVQPWQLAIVCSTTDQSDDRAGSHDTGHIDTYASYMTSLLGDSDGMKVEEVKCDEVMILASLELFLAAGPSIDILIETSGKPRSVSHKIHWPNASLLIQLVDMCVTMTTKHLTQAIALCERYGYWLGVVQLAAVVGDKRKSLSIILSLRDVRLLKEKQRWRSLLVNVADWTEALHIMCDITSHVTSHVTEDELTMSDLIHVMVDNVGPSLALQILSSVGGTGGVASGEAGPELHSLMIQLAAIHAQQKKVGRSLLEKVDRYLWSRQPVAISPQLQEIEEREREKRHNGQETGLDVIQTNMEWKPTLEDSSRHWGVRVGGGRVVEEKGLCGVCHSSLSVTVSLQQPGLLLFPCGHAYHRHCIPEMACYLCFKENFIKHCSCMA